MRPAKLGQLVGMAVLTTVRTPIAVGE